MSNALLFDTQNKLIFNYIDHKVDHNFFYPDVDSMSTQKQQKDLLRKHQ